MNVLETILVVLEAMKMENEIQIGRASCRERV